MCPHDSFEIIYYVGGVMLRRCKNCGQVELRLDWDWQTLQAIQAALDAVK